MKRREFSKGLVALGLGAVASSSEAMAQPVTDEDHDAIVDAILNELEAIQGQRIDAVGRSNIPGADRSVLRRSGTDAGFAVPPITPELQAALNTRKYWDLNPAPSPRWAAHSSDYGHLEAFPLASSQFELTASLLRVLADRNAFVINDVRPVLIFGLRGCKIVNGADSASWSLTHQLEVIEPAHLDCQCIVGVMRKSDGMIALFRASTVPAVDAIYTSLPQNGAGTSLLPTGLYAYSVGSHRAAYPTRIQRAALLIQSPYCVLRTAQDLCYDPFAAGDAWTRGANHNIHAAGEDLRKFQSSGCQVIPGKYINPARLEATREWGDFRRAAGLVDAGGAAIASDTTPTFQYMLLTGREAAIAYQGGGAFDQGYRRLRPGSSGPAVARLQTQLFAKYPDDFGGQSANGVFGMMTAFAVLMHKKDTEGEFTSPIASI